MAPKEDRKDPTWAYSSRVSETNKMAIRCLFCDKISNGGVYRQNAHLIGGDSNVASCTKVSEHNKATMLRRLHQNHKSGEGCFHQCLLVVDLLAMDCYFAQKSGDKGGKSGLPFNCVNYTYIFAAFIEAVDQYGPGMKPPTYYEVKGSYLKKEVAEVNKIVEEHKVSLFLESVDASDSSTDSTKMYSLFKSTIDSIGAENVVQVVTDNASENVKASDLMSVGPLLLNMMKKFTKRRNLVKPAKTRFATAFLASHRMYEQKSNLKKLFVSDEYTNSVYGREARGRESADIILSPSFWNNEVHALKIGDPLVKVLRLVDGEQRPSMGYLYEAIDRAKELDLF
uniref:Uncharacterized protein LOC104216547 n=1 Tax=Nicotiana sylvestris TaxID=4096 RepID=A0A1U7VEY7_NICSY|nr:PREDICTED: uncharacterized protein LOC104216547 [Nicotiana sylvestris]